ncbi:glycosyltransferase family 4 protein [Vibrio cholerae]|nr:glycosyltransferase [Vibrio cholerae]EGR4421137.1 glycosyltransferase [Vibrio cholerae]EGR4432037.1 glycosyltransferase [Vibrio cholerae]HAS5578481.1 glycosyltransferase family 4 protein [Vibrio cholerae]
MSKIYFFTPAVPQYRVPFFDLLNKSYELKVCSSEIDFLGVETVKELKFVEYDCGFYNIFNKLYWSKANLFRQNYSSDDIVIINGNPRILNYMALFLFLRFRRIKTVWWGHGWSASSRGFSSKIRLLLAKYLPDHCLFYTDVEREKIGIPNSFSLNNGLINSKLILNNINIVNVKRAPIDSSILKVAFIGRITAKSKFDLLLRSLIYVDFDIRLTVIGESCSEDILVMAKEYGVESKIDFLGKIYDESKIEDVFKDSHVFVYPGSVGLSLIHAFNYGLPAIVHSSLFDHMPEISAFSCGYNGISFSKDDEYSLASALEKIKNMPRENYFNMSNQALLTVSKTYNINDMVERFIRMIEKIQ